MIDAINYFEKNFFNKINENDYVGVEIEMPIISLNKPFQVNEDVVKELFINLVRNNYEPISYDNEKNIIAVKNMENGDTISLEYSFNTLEFSLNKEHSIYELKKKFSYYYEYINNYLKEYNHKLYDGGINPRYRKINKKCLNQNRYKTIERLLVNKNNDLFSKFCSYCCSIQTHINVSKENLVDVLNTFTKIENIKSKMFGNSYMDETGLNNSRIYLWEHSNFGPYNIGSNKIYKTIDELKRSYLYRSLFFVERDNKFLLLDEKQRVCNYLSKDFVEATDEHGNKVKIKPKIEDFDNFRSYKSVELSRYGTLEIRTDCTQKYDNIFKLVAFNVGVKYKSKEILDYIKKHKRISKKQLLEFSKNGLIERGKKEEKLLEE